MQQERVQSYERAMYSWQNDSGLIEDASVLNLSSIVKMYRPTKPSYASPMERFKIISTINEPTTLFAQAAMHYIGIDIGSLDTIHLRSGDAKVAAGIEIEVDDAEVLLGRDLLKRYKEARIAGQSGKTAVERDVRNGGEGSTKDKRPKLG